jgi:hypothetical protein
LNPDPNELLEFERIPHPWLPVETTEQSVDATNVPDILSEVLVVEGNIHPGLV